jgi:hypothetical protein
MLRKEKKRKSRGWVPFGYRYLGPGNDLYRGPPTTTGDAAAQKHDWHYKYLEDQGKRPKLQYSEADDDFINEVGTKHYSEWIAKNLFRVKRKFAELGIIDDIRPWQKNKRETSLNDWKQFITPEKKATLSSKNISPDKKSDPTVRKSLFNLQSDENMSGANGGSGTEAGLRETPVDQVTTVYRGPPDHTFASLPFYDEYNLSHDMVVADFAFRPTSPYDCKVDLDSSVDLNPNATGSAFHYPVIPSTSTDASSQRARWFDYYASMYKYYHVIACKYEIYVENQTTDDVWVHFMPLNDVNPPINATNVDMLQWSDCQSKCLSARAIAIQSTGVMENNDAVNNTSMDESSNPAPQTANYESANLLENQIGSVAHVFRGVYRTGDYSRQIRLDANVENWTQVTTNPALVERLLLRIKTHWDSNITTDDVNNRNRFTRVIIRTKMEYLVEFKELKDGLKYPTNDQPMTVVINSNP